jgi:hypothetical protein
LFRTFILMVTLCDHYSLKYYLNLLNESRVIIYFWDSRSKFWATILADSASFSATRRRSDSWLKSLSYFKSFIFNSSISDSNLSFISAVSFSLKNEIKKCLYVIWLLLVSYYNFCNLYWYAVWSRYSHLEFETHLYRMKLK